MKEKSTVEQSIPKSIEHTKIFYSNTYWEPFFFAKKYELGFIPRTTMCFTDTKTTCCCSVSMTFLCTQELFVSVLNHDLIFLKTFHMLLTWTFVLPTICIKHNCHDYTCIVTGHGNNEAGCPANGSKMAPYKHILTSEILKHGRGGGWLCISE